MLQQRKYLLPLLLTLSLLAVNLGCSDSDYRKAAKAAHDISVGLLAAESAMESAYTAGQITKDEARGLARYINDATLANDQFVAQLRAAKAFGPVTKATIGQLFKNVTASISTLNNQGVLHITNKDAQTKLQLTLATVDVAVAVIQSILMGGQ